MNQNQTPYKEDNGNIIKDTHIILDKKIDVLDLKGLSFPSYLHVSENLLTNLGFNVEIKKVNYKDIKTGKFVIGSLLIDKNDKNNFFHFIINGGLPEFKHNTESPLTKEAKINDNIKIIQHKKDLPLIISSEFKIKEIRKDLNNSF